MIVPVTLHITDAIPFCMLCSIRPTVAFLFDYSSSCSSFIAPSRLDTVSLYTHVVSTMFASLNIELDPPPRSSASSLSSLPRLPPVSSVTLVQHLHLHEGVTYANPSAIPTGKPTCQAPGEPALTGSQVGGSMPAGCHAELR